MTATYQKDGRALLLTRSRGVLTMSSVAERGVAGESQGRFFSMSLEPEGAAAETGEFTPLRLLEERIAAVAQSTRIERLHLLSGWSRHRHGEGRMWEERHVRLHLEWSAPSNGLRVTTTRGGAELSDIDVDELGVVAGALRSPGSDGVDVSGGIALAPPVAAAIAAAASRAGGEIQRIRLVQVPHPSWPRDGAGRMVVKSVITDAPPPNRWRPSYRSPSVPAPLNVEIEPADAREAPETTAIETIGPVHIAGNRARISVLMTNGVRAAVKEIEIDLEGLAVARAAGPRRWFPFAAGAWGRLLVAGQARIISG